jgi:DUF1016 N-terminal domain
MEEHPMLEIRTAEPAGYAEFLAELKQRIERAQLRASLAVNRELVLLYWQIGREILSRQDRENWGAKVIERLAADLKRSFPDMRGFSPNTCALSPKPGQRRNLCKRCLHKSLDTTTLPSSRNSKLRRTAPGMRALRSSTAGAETFSFTKSNQPSMSARAGQ